MPRVEGNYCCGLFVVKVVKEKEEEEGKKKMKLAKKKKGINGEISAAAL